QVQKHVALSASIYNLLDKRYAFPAGQLLEPPFVQDGRNFRLKMTVHFSRTADFRMRNVFLMALIWFIAAQVATGQSPGASEYEVKAAFLYNFAKFVEWPPNTFSDDGPLRFCVVGKDPFGGELETTIQGRTVGGRQLAVWRPHSAEESRHCQVLFVSISGRGVVKELLTELRGAPVLTVGEDREFLRSV